MFHKIDVKELKQNVFNEYENNWMIISAKDPEGKINGMTVSWGALGRFWEKDTVTAYIRQSRYTKEFIDSQDYFTISMFDGHKKELGIYGSKSGRDCDKLAESGMHLVETASRLTKRVSAYSYAKNSIRMISNLTILQTSRERHTMPTVTSTQCI